MVANIGVDSGQLRHLITIEQNNPTYDAANQPIDNWETFLIRWGKIESIQGGDFIQSAQIRNKCSHTCTMRYLPTLQPKLHRLVYQGRTFNVVSVIVSDERKISTVAYCQEVL